MGTTARYYGKLLAGVIVGFLVLDKWTGTKAIIDSGIGGITKFTKTAQGRA